MSLQGTSSDRLSVDDRYELAAKAKSQHRLNNPSHLIVLGVLLVFVSIVVLVIAWRVRSAAIETNVRKSNQVVQIDQIIAQIRELEQTQASSSAADRYAPIPDMLLRFKRYAAQAKLSNELGIPKTSTQPQGDARKLIYTYTVRDPSLERLLEWVKISTQQVPGLEINDITIKPSKTDWTITTIFARYERTQ
jgi:Na+-transporting methylmalonyl-CoA/oxaloacetate decarboxylase gamma subunit